MPAESICLLNAVSARAVVWVLRIRPCGDCLTYGPGHYKTWDHWRRDRTVEPALRAIVQSSETKNVWVLGANGRVAYYCTAAYTRLSRLSHADVARSRRRRVISAVEPDKPV